MRLESEAEESLTGGRSNTTTERRHVPPLLDLHLLRVCHFTLLIHNNRGISCLVGFTHVHILMSDVFWERRFWGEKSDKLKKGGAPTGLGQVFFLAQL